MLLPSHPQRKSLLLSLLIGLFLTVTTLGNEFNGPFPSWYNIKSRYGALGNGIADDTAAFVRALDEVGKSGHSKVLYLPAGTYRISSTVTLWNRIGISIIGEHPETTRIKWVGPADGKMFYIDGVAYSRFNRITFDGSGTARIAIDQSWSNSGGYFDTSIEYSDNMFFDVGTGIRGGNYGHGFADISVLRCRFIRNTTAGLVVKNWNALDVNIRDCYFENNQVGVTNDPGAGNFGVFNSIFKDSIEADIKIGAPMIFSFRGNQSFGSSKFILATWQGDNGGPITLQNNKIYNTGSNPVDIQQLGPVTLLDNIVKGEISIPKADMISIGNRWRSAQMNGRVRSVDDVVDSNIATPAIPGPVAFAPKVNRPTIEIAPGSGAAAIQGAINSAAALNGQKPVIHFPAGTFYINQTLNIPANTDMQLVGDGGGSVLDWNGGDGGTVLRLIGPSKASLHTLQVMGGNGRATGIEVVNFDYPGSRIFMQQPRISYTRKHGLLVDNVNHALIEAHDFIHDLNTENSVTVLGGGANGGRVNLFAGASSDNGLSYEVTGGGKLLVQDMWYESPNQNLTRFLRVTGNSVLTFAGGKTAFYSGSNTAGFDFSNFTGTAAILSSVTDDKFVTSGAGGAKILLGGLQHDPTPNPFIFDNAKTGLVLLNSRRYDGGSQPLSNIGSPADEFLRAAFAQTRAEKTLTQADLSLHRVTLYNGKIGMHVIGTEQRDSQPKQTPRATSVPTSLPEATPELTLNRTSAPARISHLTLVDSETGDAIPDYDPLADGAVLNLSILPGKSWNIIAATDPSPVGSVQFLLNSSVFRTQNQPPYAMAGDADSSYYGWRPAAGTYTLTAVPYAKADANGAAGESLIITFVVIENVRAQPQFEEIRALSIKEGTTALEFRTDAVLME